ncbi:NAD(P)-binding protein [Auriscalpium vulgare]|uniref:NAD(P)-binding protein n=1 Tax=Auriscalpium vulgare TaxID=40419 RepID=A0ACB8RZK8_9AGAM|nr:NAD(P)-binding protein [Auriscalpium vulgare]
MSLTKGVAFVTGAARGMGRGIALRLAHDGFDVAVNDIPGAVGLEDVSKDIERLGRRSYVAFGDVTSEQEVAGAIDRVVEKLGSLDVMVANAGIFSYGGVLDLTLEDYDRVMAVNARGVMLCYKYAAKQMVAQGRGGRIVGAASLAGKQGYPGTFAYCASKFAVRGMTQCAAAELGKHGITVNAYAPGAIDTQMSSSLKLSLALDLVVDHATILTLVAASPIARLGIPEDVANLVSFLASKESSFVTGTVLVDTFERAFH